MGPQFDMINHAEQGGAKQIRHEKSWQCIQSAPSSLLKQIQLQLQASCHDFCLEQLGMILNPYKEAHLRPQHLDSTTLFSAFLEPATSWTSWTLFLQTSTSFQNCLDFPKPSRCPQPPEMPKCFMVSIWPKEV